MRSGSAPKTPRVPVRPSASLHLDATVQAKVNEWREGIKHKHSQAERRERKPSEIFPCTSDTPQLQRLRLLLVSGGPAQLAEPPPLSVYLAVAPLPLLLPRSLRGHTTTEQHPSKQPSRQTASLARHVHANQTLHAPTNSLSIRLDDLASRSTHSAGPRRRILSRHRASHRQ